MVATVRERGTGPKETWLSFPLSTFEIASIVSSSSSLFVKPDPFVEAYAALFILE